MKTINVESDGSKNYSVLLNGSIIAAIRYPKWYSSIAELDFGNSHYTIQSRGFWKMVQEVKKGDRVMLEGKYKWKGMQLSRPGGQPYLMKSKGTWGGSYGLFDNTGTELINITSNFSWKKFTSSYIITCKDDFGDDEFEMLLMLATIHFYKMYQAMAGSAAV